jgi:DNA invertase Pin-like site-specific DNA recombinase
MTKTPKILCAIYTRKSSEEGLEQEFNSLDAQREACAAYVTSQKGEGWVLLTEHYDDGGISGGTLERPAVQRLLADIDAGKVDRVIVYKVDRLTRSLADFAKLVDRFEAAGASFVSVTQSFNTATSMGRLTLNVLLSFAQFEREVTAERIRDKIAASKRKGLWMGGMTPLGYEAKDRTLKINRTEAELVRTLFRLYLDLGCVRKVKEEADRLGLRSRRRVFASGKVYGGVPFTRGALTTCCRTRSMSVRSGTRRTPMTASTRRSSGATSGRPSRRSSPTMPRAPNAGRLQPRRHRWQESSPTRRATS